MHGIFNLHWTSPICVIFELDISKLVPDCIALLNTTNRNILAIILSTIEWNWLYMLIRVKLHLYFWATDRYAMYVDVLYVKHVLFFLSLYAISILYISLAGVLRVMFRSFIAIKSTFLPVKPSFNWTMVLKIFVQTERIRYGLWIQLKLCTCFVVPDKAVRGHKCLHNALWT